MKLLTMMLFVILVASASAAAQTSPEETILAEGREPLTAAMVDRLADFFEWSLERKLSEDERAEFQTEIVENWKNADCREIRGALYALEFSQEIEHLDEARREQARRLIKERFYREFELSETNKVNALLFGLVREKHGRIDTLAAALK